MTSLRPIYDKNKRNVQIEQIEPQRWGSIILQK
jgi:hypothetical protein